MQLSPEVDLHGRYLSAVLGALVFLQGSNTHGQRRLIYIVGQHLRFTQGSKGLKAELLSLESFKILMDALGRNRVVIVGWGQCPNSSVFSEKIVCSMNLGLSPRVLKPSTMLPRRWALLTSLRHNYEPEMPPLRMWPVDIVYLLGPQG